DPRRVRHRPRARRHRGRRRSREADPSWPRGRRRRDRAPGRLVVMSVPMSATIAVSGNAALRVSSTLADREAGWRLVHHLARFIDDARVPGIACVVPTYDAALIEIDPVEASLERVRSYVESVLERIDVGRPLTETPRLFDVPVLYDLDGELDLAMIAEA